MRLFVAVTPPAEVLDVVAALPRPDVDGVRWTSRDQWHVTLRFLGAVPEHQVNGLIERLGGALAPAAVVEAVMGPATARFGSGILHLPVTGLDRLADLVASATADVGDAAADRHPFHGHLTLARGRGRRSRVPGSLAGTEARATWTVRHVDLVASELHPEGSRYRTVASFPLAS